MDRTNNQHTMKLTQQSVVSTRNIRNHILYALDQYGVIHIRYTDTIKKQSHRQALVAILHSYNNLLTQIKESEVEGNRYNIKEIEEINDTYADSTDISDKIHIKKKQKNPEEEEIQIIQEIYIQESIQEALTTFSEQLRTHITHKER